MSDLKVSDIVEYQVPLDFVETQLISSDVNIERRYQRYINPREGALWGYDSSEKAYPETLTDNTIFHISNPKDYLDMVNSYFICDFEAKAETKAGAPLLAALDVGGIHNCIQSVRVRVGGVELTYMQDYQKFYNCLNIPTHDETYTDFVLASCGDSVAQFSTDAGDGYNYRENVNIDNGFTPANGKSLTAAGVLTVGDGAFLTKLNLGDIIRLDSKVGGNDDVQYGIVSSITDDTVAGLSRLANAGGPYALTGGFTAVTGADANNRLLTITKVSRRPIPTRQRMINSDRNRLSWRFPMKCLNLPKYFPMKYIQNLGPLEIEIQWARPSFAIVLQSGGAADNKIGYKITNFQFIASFITPDAEVIKMHDMQYNSPEGITFSYLDYKHLPFDVPTGSTNVNLSHLTNLSSVKHVISVLTNSDDANSDVIATQTANSNSTFNKCDMIAYRFSCGGLQFPEYREVRCDGVSGCGEVFSQMQLTFNHMSNTLLSNRIKPYEWFSRNSTKWFITTPTTKDNTVWSGLNTKNNYLDLNLQFNGGGVASKQILHSFIGFDKICVIQRSVGLRIWT
jgi:hypothetical protein